jgi:hypothetical protein
MSEATPELKALIFTLAARRIAKRQQKGELITTTRIQYSTTSTGHSNSPLIPISTNYIDNLLIAYSLEQTPSTPANNDSLNIIPEEPATEDDKTPTNKSQELPN